MPLDYPLSPSASLEHYLFGSLASGKRDFNARGASLNLYRMEFEDAAPVRVVRDETDCQTLQVTLTFNLSSLDGNFPDRAVEVIEDWADDLLYAWVSAQDAASPLPNLQRSRTPTQWGSAPTWRVQL